MVFSRNFRMWSVSDFQGVLNFQKSHRINVCFHDLTKMFIMKPPYHVSNISILLNTLKGENSPLAPGPNFFLLFGKNDDDHYPFNIAIPSLNSRVAPIAAPSVKRNSALRIEGDITNSFDFQIFFQAVSYLFSFVH